MTKIVFISGHYFGKKALQGLLDSEEFKQQKLAIELTLCLHPRNAVNTVGFTDLSSFCIEYGLNYAVFNSIKSNQVYETIASIPHNFLLAVGLSQIVPAKILHLPALHNGSHAPFSESHAAIGMHPTLLPVGRGRAPIPWTLLKRIRNSGVSAFILGEGADTGPIILQEPLTITESETAYTLFHRVAQVHYNLSKQLSSMLAGKALSWTVQNELNSSVWGKRTPADGWIDFSMTSDKIIDLINALASPYPEAFFVYKDQLLHVQHASVSLPNPSGFLPGTIVDVDYTGYPQIACTDGVLLLITRDNVESYRVGDRIFSEQRRVIDNV